MLRPLLRPGVLKPKGIISALAKRSAHQMGNNNSPNYDGPGKTTITIRNEETQLLMIDG